MKFPGSKLLHTWDLSVHKLGLDDLLRSCEQVNLTGFAELKLASGVGMVFFYVGAEVNAVYRRETVAYNGAAALDRLREDIPTGDGLVTVFELPLEMAHLLRGVVNRRKLQDKVVGASGFAECLARLEGSEHTGTLEVQTSAGSGIVLLVNGRTSNTYWETKDGVTFEKKEARDRLDRALDAAPGQAYVSEFSREVWKGRHEVPNPVARRTGWKQDSAEKLAEEETATRQQILTELQQQVPSLVQALIVDLMTGVVLARRTRGTGALRVSLLAEKVPALTSYLRDLVAAGDDEVDLIEVSTNRAAMVVAVVPAAEEAIAVIADKSQPTAMIAGALSHLARVYKSRLHPSRGKVTV